MNPQPVNPDDLGRGPWVVAVTWVFTAFAAVALGLQLYVRKKTVRRLGWEDWFMLVAVVVRVAHQIQVSVSLKYGLGKHDRDLTPDQLIMVLKYNWSSIPANTVVSTLARVSIAVLLVRLFGIHLWLKYFLIILTVLQAVLGVVFIFITYFMTTPVEALWNIFITDAKRWDPRIWLYFAYFLQSLYTFSDLTFTLFPILIIWSLNMALSRKIGLMLLLSASLVSMGLSILKTVWISTASKATQNTPDVQYEACFQVLFGILEQDFVITMGCVPALRGILHMEFPIFSHLGASIASLLRRTTKTDKSSHSLHPEYDSSSAYHNLELDTRKLGNPGRRSDTHAVDYRQVWSEASLAQKGKQVTRTDQFAVSYDDGSEDPAHRV